MMPNFYEFFAGGGLARLGLGPNWRCEFANDWSQIKADSYRRNFTGPAENFAHGDIKELIAQNLPGKADLIWGSFPCQDLSVAGSGKGLNGSRSGLIWNLLDIVRQLRKENRAPKALALENVNGLLSSNGGQDFYDILFGLKQEGYLFGTLMIDAVHFLPQSRPRIFLVAVDWKQIVVQPSLINGRTNPSYSWSSSRLERLWEKAPWELRKNWLWWNLPSPSPRKSTIEDILETSASNWDSEEYTTNLLELMTPLHQKKVEQAMRLGAGVVGTLYRRTRVVDGERAQRVEVRFDGVSGCLRTPSGGSSRQRLLFVKDQQIRSRLLTSREAARLMGIPDSYRLPDSYNHGYQVAGDGVAVPVVRWLSDHLLLPLLSEDSGIEAEAELLYA